MTALVYRTARGRVWHWPGSHTFDGAPTAACTSWPLDPTEAADPVSVPMGDRCTGMGCRQRWETWLRRAILRAQADEIGRLHAELGAGAA